MSPERTNNVTSLPVRPDRSQRADQQQAPASDFFATLLDAHADRAADRAPSRRERQPSEDGPRDRRPVDHPARPDRPADVRDRSKPAPAADHQPSEPSPTDEPAPADQAAAAAAASAMLGLLAAVTPQQQPTTPAAPATEPAAVDPQATPAPQAVAQVPAVVPQPAAPATDVSAVEPQAAPRVTAEDVAPVQGPETAGIEGSKPDAPAAPAPAAVATEEAATTSVAGRASVADSGNTRPGDRRSEGVSGGGAEARPSADAPVNPQPTTQGQDSGSQQSDQRQGDAHAPRTMQPAAPAAAQAPRVDVAPIAVSGQAHVPAQSAEPKGAASLAQAPRAVGQLIHIASERGVQHARLNLKPVELGGIEIRLIASSAGVTAHVVADSPEAARLLQQAGDDLRRSLADNNVELLSLDVSTSDQERRDASAAGGFEQFGESGPQGRDGLGRPHHHRGGETGTDLPISTDQGTVIELPDGVLVDVLA